eukprot:Opistho-1_new@76999
MAAIEGASSLLTQYAALAKSLFEALLAAADSSQRIGQGGAPAADPVAIARTIVEKDAELRMALRQVEEHQRFQRRIEALREAVGRHNTQIASAISQLRLAETELEAALDVAKERMALMRQAKAGAVDPVDLVRYASYTSYSSSAPPGWQPNMPLGPYSTPFPTDVQMRSGLLYSVSEAAASVVASRPLADEAIKEEEPAPAAKSPKRAAVANGKRKREPSPDRSRAPKRAVTLDLNPESDED